MHYYYIKADIANATVLVKSAIVRIFGNAVLSFS